MKIKIYPKQDCTSSHRTICLLIIIGMLSIALIGCAKKQAEISTETATPLAEKEKKENEGEQTMRTNVLIKTNMGDITVQLYDELTPKTAKNFKDLTAKGFYNGIIFHRVIDGFMIQGGDPSGTGGGGPGYSIPDEFVKSLRHNKKGLLSMANRGPNTGGSQFFITLAPTNWLDDRHTIFGEVTAGMDVVEKMAKVQVDSGDKPIRNITMQEVKVIP